MTDRELLELAAKAAGYPLIESTRRLTKDKYFEIVYNAAGNRAVWSPLTNDGDALRLAATLRIDVRHWDGPDRISGEHPSLKENSIMVDVCGGPLWATRRAIVRAAAEIGKELK